MPDQLGQTQRALRESESRFQLLADSIPQLAWMARPDGWLFWYNKRWFDYTGTTLDDMQGWGWRRVHHPDHVDRVVTRFQAALQTGTPWEDTFPLLSRDKVWRWFLSRAMPVLGDDKRINMWFGTNTDITEILDAEERQRNLLDELNHRVKNTLSVVQSIASQTIKGSDDLASFKDKFEGRLLALSKSHNLLAQEVWQGATLSDIVREALEAYQQGDVERIKTSGPRVMLGPTAAVSLGMAFHELATNAAKYGSLSVPEGTVDVEWSTDFRGGLVPAVVLVWKEMGGPSVVLPSRTGFGSRLLTKNLATELDSQIDIDFKPEGLVVAMRLPLSRTVTLGSTSAPHDR